MYDSQGTEAHPAVFGAAVTATTEKNPDIKDIIRQYQYWVRTSQ